MKFALFDILSGDYKDPEFNSIKAHLIRLLNTRAGSLQHLPDYGLPDVTELYRDLPSSVPVIVKAIKNAIEKYEPRLHNILLRHNNYGSNNDCVLHIEISASTESEQDLNFYTYFNSEGIAEISGNKYSEYVIM